MSLPSTPVTIAHRSDSSGTTANFTQFLTEAGGSAWTLGAGSVVNWPGASRGGNGNSGVAQIIKSTPGAVGYVDYADAKASSLVFAYFKNKDGQYVAPSVDAASAAASKATIKPDLTFSAIWAPGADSYPITAQSWVLVYQNPVEHEHYGDAQGVHRLPGRRRPEAAPGLGLRAAALQYRPAGPGGGKQNRQLGVSVVTREDSK